MSNRLFYEQADWRRREWYAAQNPAERAAHAQALEDALSAEEPGYNEVDTAKLLVPLPPVPSAPGDAADGSEAT